MDISDFTSEENLALVGLLKAIIQADKSYSKDESVALKKIAELRALT